MQNFVAELQTYSRNFILANSWDVQMLLGSAGAGRYVQGTKN